MSTEQFIEEVEQNEDSTLYLAFDMDGSLFWNPEEISLEKFLNSTIPPGMTEYQYLAILYDIHCKKPENREKYKAKLANDNKKLLDFIQTLINNKKPKKIVIYNASMRQDFGTDVRNSLYAKRSPRYTISAFTASIFMQELIKESNPHIDVQIHKPNLADIFSTDPLAAAISFEAAQNPETAVHLRSIADEQKPLITYHTAQSASSYHEKLDTVHDLHIFDDRFGMGQISSELGKPLYDFFYANSKLIPRNICLHLQRYAQGEVNNDDANKISWFPPIQGTGDPDKTYAFSLHFMAGVGIGQGQNAATDRPGYWKVLDNMPPEKIQTLLTRVQNQSNQQVVDEIIRESLEGPKTEPSSPVSQSTSSLAAYPFPQPPSNQGVTKSFDGSW